MSRAPKAAAPGVGPARTIGSRYVPLFNVAIRHGYYNATGGACPDFRVVPTPACAKLMTSLGMIFWNRGAGFGVQIDEARIPAMIAYVRRDAQAASPGVGCWTRLSFTLVSTNSDFLGITSLPITTSPLTQRLYASNLDAVAEEGQLMLGGGPASDADLIPMCGASLTVATPAGISATLLDISNGPVAVAVTTDAISTRFAMGGLADGLYTVRFDIKARKKAPPQQSYLYAPSQPPSFGLIDLLLAQPTAGEGVASAFPVEAMTPPVSSGAASAPEPTIQPVDLTLSFEPRQTYWNYYICSQDKAAQFAPNLKVKGSGTQFEKTTAQLPNGDPAVLFSATLPLPLQQVSDYRFELSGQCKRAGGGQDDISIDWLPASPASPVWPAPTGEPLAGVSEIYVYV